MLLAPWLEACPFEQTEQPIPARSHMGKRGDLVMACRHFNECFLNFTHWWVNLSATTVVSNYFSVKLNNTLLLLTASWTVSESILLSDPFLWLLLLINLMKITAHSLQPAQARMTDNFPIEWFDSFLFGSKHIASTEDDVSFLLVRKLILLRRLISTSTLAPSFSAILKHRTFTKCLHRYS